MTCRQHVNVIVFFLINLCKLWFWCRRWIYLNKTVLIQREDRSVNDYPIFRIRIKLFVSFECKTKRGSIRFYFEEKMAEEGRTDPPPLFENVNISGENNSDADLFVSARQVLNWIWSCDILFTLWEPKLVFFSNSPVFDAPLVEASQHCFIDARLY